MWEQIITRFDSVCFFEDFVRIREHDCKCSSAFHLLYAFIIFLVNVFIYQQYYRDASFQHGKRPVFECTPGVTFGVYVTHLLILSSLLLRYRTFFSQYKHRIFLINILLPMGPYVSALSIVSLIWCCSFLKLLKYLVDFGNDVAFLRKPYCNEWKH